MVHVAPVVQTMNWEDRYYWEASHPQNRKNYRVLQPKTKQQDPKTDEHASSFSITKTGFPRGFSDNSKLLTAGRQKIQTADIKLFIQEKEMQRSFEKVMRRLAHLGVLL